MSDARNSSRAIPLYCRPCHDRGQQGVPANHVVSGEGFCDACFKDAGGSEYAHSISGTDEEGVRVLAKEDGFEVVEVRTIPKPQTSAMMRAIVALKGMDYGKAVRLPVPTDKKGNRVATHLHEYSSRCGIVIKTRVDKEKKFVYAWKPNPAELAVRKEVKSSRAAERSAKSKGSA